MDKKKNKGHDKRSRSDHSDKMAFEKVLKINRVTKVNKGGKRLAFRSLVVVGTQEGQVGISTGKGREVPQAIRQAVEKAKANLSKVLIEKGSVSHSVYAKYGAAKVLIKPARPGTGIIAGGSIRVLLEAAGYSDVIAKSLGASKNPINTAYAALACLKKLKKYEDVLKKRNVEFTVTCADGSLYSIKDKNDTEAKEKDLKQKDVNDKENISDVNSSKDVTAKENVKTPASVKKKSDKKDTEKKEKNRD